MRAPKGVRTGALAVALLGALVYPALPAKGEETVRMSLEEAIARARANSVQAAVALDELRTAYWEYRSYRANLLPELTFKGTLPTYRKQYSSYMNSEGGFTFVPNDYLQLNGELSMTQNIWLTGGKISLNTQLDFMRQLDNNPYNRFMSIPIALTLEQPLFAANTIKWSRKIEPARYAEAKAKYISDSEEVAMAAVSCYFQLLMAQENHRIAEQNLENATKLYEVAKEKREMGRISQNDLLQMELNVLNAKSDLTDSRSEMRNCMFRLRSMLDLGEDVEIEPEVPATLPQAEVSYDAAQGARPQQAGDEPQTAPAGGRLRRGAGEGRPAADQRVRAGGLHGDVALLRQRLPRTERQPGGGDRRGDPAGGLGKATREGESGGEQPARD